MIAFLCTHCTSEVEDNEETKVSPTLQKDKTADVSNAIEKRIQGKSVEAIKILRQLNQEYPGTPEVLLQLARALFENKQFELAAFRFDQVNSIQVNNSVFRESGLAYEYANEFTSAISRYKSYLSENVDDEEIWLRLARLYALNGQETEALNAFSKGSGKSTYDDCIMMADLFFTKKLIQQAEYWYQQAASKQEGIQPEPLLGLLRISLLNKDNKNSESLILAIEKNHPGTIEETDLGQEATQLLKSQRLGDFIRADVDVSLLNVTELAAFLSAPKKLNKEPVIALSKIPPSSLIEGSSNSQPLEITRRDTPDLASVFSDPPVLQSMERKNIEEARQAFLNRQYLETIQLARAAIKENSQNAEAWRLSSQAHFQIGETREAEMTILEALRHDPDNLEIRMDYLRVARETLDPKRYLEELENAREKFPEAVDLVWELARRYHLIERMPVTAGILYRQVLELTPESSALNKRAKIELLKLGDL